MNTPNNEHLYFMGIGGTGMATVAGLFHTMGYQVSGSDTGLYPPMSTMLEELGIPVQTPYDPQNLERAKPTRVVVANALSRGHPELEAALATGFPYTSFPALLGEEILSRKVPLVVAGTHGKTTTASLLAHVLHELGEDPGFVIGGIPRNFPRSFRAGGGPLFVVEGDEYDTAFFDKQPKFLHYRPHHLILNNLEFDHADIYADLEAIETQFTKACGLVPAEGAVIANTGDPGIERLMRLASPGSPVVRVSPFSRNVDSPCTVTNYDVNTDGQGHQRWDAELYSNRWGEFSVETGLAGRHNLMNLCQVIACVASLEKRGLLRHPVTPAKLQAAVASFSGVARRMDLLGRFGGIDVYEDFAHHPTAVRHVIEGFRRAQPKRRLVVAFEPRSATQRRNVFQNDYSQALALADRVFIGACPRDTRIPSEERMDTQSLARTIGSAAQAFDDNEALLDTLSGELRTGDTVIFMSSGSFSGIHHKLARRLAERTASA